MRAKMLRVLTGLLLLPAVLRADGGQPAFCGYPNFWILHDLAASSTTADGRTIEIGPINDYCWIECFPVYSYEGRVEGRYRLFNADGTLGETGTWRGETIQYKYESCPVEVPYLLGGRVIYRVQFSADDGTEFAGSMEVRSQGDWWYAAGSVRVWIGSRGLEFDRPSPVRIVFWAF